MSCFQATAPYLAQVILSALGAGIRPAVLKQVHFCCLSDPCPLEGVGWDLFPQKYEKPEVLEFFLLLLHPLA